MKQVTAWADELVERLNPVLARFPDGFFDSFDYTSTGNNYCHPLTLGTLCRIMWELSGVEAVGVDVRLNLGGGAKMQPDLVAFDAAQRPILMVDYESPNSSDARIPWKDVDQYCRWNAACGLNVPYLIVTTLPDRPVDEWERRYVYGDGYNTEFKGRDAEVRSNPFRFWSS